MSTTDDQMHKARLPGETGFCVVILLFSVTFLYLSYKISGFSSWTSAGSLPMGTTLVMTVASIVILFRELAKPAPQLRAAESLTRGFFEQVFPLRHIIFVGVLIVYMFLLEPLGFITDSYLYLIASSVVLGERRWLRLILVNALTLAAVYLVFQTVFSVVLPTGPVEALFR